MRQIWYHAHCMDGFGALAAYWTGQHCPADIEVIPMSYGDQYNISGIDEVIMLDFSVEADFIRNICSRVSKVTVIDHHKTAQKDLEQCVDIQNLELVFDMEKSGAVLTWEYFHPGKEVPLILKYIQDRDLWKWNLLHSKEISAYLKHQGYKDNTWLQGLLMLNNVEHLISEGKFILSVQREIYEHICKNAKYTVLDGHPVICINSPCFQSDIGDYLNQKIKDENLHEKFVVIWWDDGKDTVYSLRSQGDFDVSEVAVNHGGGGHKNAAGFKTDNNKELMWWKP